MYTLIDIGPSRNTTTYSRACHLVNCPTDSAACAVRLPMPQFVTIRGGSQVVDRATRGRIEMLLEPRERYTSEFKCGVIPSAATHVTFEQCERK